MSNNSARTEWGLIDKSLLLDTDGGDKMQVTKSEKFVKAEDIEKTGTQFTIIEEPKEHDGTYGMELTTRVKMQNGESTAKAKWRINDTNKDLLINAFGTDTADWIGKTLSIHIETISGKPSIILDKEQF